MLTCIYNTAGEFKEKMAADLSENNFRDEKFLHQRVQQRIAGQYLKQIDPGMKFV